MITLEKAKNLEYRTEIFHITNRTAIGTPQKWRINGKPQTWKTMPERVKVPIKTGYYGPCDYLTEGNLDQFYLHEWEAYGEKPTFGKKQVIKGVEYYEVFFRGESYGYIFKSYPTRKKRGVWFSYKFREIRCKTREECAKQILHRYF